MNSSCLSIVLDTCGGADPDQVETLHEPVEGTFRHIARKLSDLVFASAPEEAVRVEMVEALDVTELVPEAMEVGRWEGDSAAASRTRTAEAARGCSGPPGTKGRNPQPSERFMTLVSYAAFLGRDKITSALLKAGADPTVRAGADWRGRQAEWSAAVKRAMGDDVSRLPLPVGVWLLKCLASMRHAGVTALSNHMQRPESCQTLPCAACGDSAASAPVQWKACGCVTCEPCFWRRVCEVMHTGGALDDAEPRCPSCECPLDPDAALVPEAQTLNSTHNASVWKSRSYAIWAKLPKEPDRKCPKTNKFCALSPVALKRTNVGSFQSARCESLHKAACLGDTTRILILIEAGVDVDSTNEYGQTALFLAAMHGHAKAAKLLAVMAAADLEKPANGGCTPWTTATVNGHTLVANVLVDAGANQVPATNAEQSGYLGASSHKDNSTLAPLSTRCVTVILDHAILHPGAGSFIVDGGFEDAFLDRLRRCWESLPVAPPTKPSCSDRSYYCDSEGWVRLGIQKCLQNIGPETTVSVALPNMRFLHYGQAGGYLVPHTDLSRTDAKGRTSTHTFLLYIDNCGTGGETALLEHLPKGASREDQAEIPSKNGESLPGVRTPHNVPVLAAVAPKRGRIFAFPHLCPHEGLPVVDVPKLLLRGELY
mmetsp:Transcript_2358/g.4434  ORF Transcript_2358/g.4434 Transcript_2358/m.4434 type:complete len:655 (+) Transcript_2358:613-2577(+)